MKPRTSFFRSGFTLLELVVVMALCVAVITAVYSIVQGSLTLAEETRRSQERDTRHQAFVQFMERLLRNLPTTTSLTLKTTQDGGKYLTRLELHHVASPFSGDPQGILRLFSEPVPGGGVLLKLSWQKTLADSAQVIGVTLFEGLSSCECRVFDPASRKWATLWNVSPPGAIGIATAPQADIPETPAQPQPMPAEHLGRPLALEFQLRHGDGSTASWFFWISPTTPVTL